MKKISSTQLLRVRTRQVDLLLAKRIAEKKSDLIVSRDSDFCAHTGSDVIQIKDTKLHNNKKN